MLAGDAPRGAVGVVRRSVKRMGAFRTPLRITMTVNSRSLHIGIIAVLRM
jgi:hypothetical protein